MAFTASETRMVLAYNNKVLPENVSTVTITNATADASHPAANLKYDDPWRRLKVPANPSAAPVIDFTFSASQQFTCFGIVNHDLYTGGYGIEFAYHNGTTFVSIGTATPTSDGDLLVRSALTPAATVYRLILTRGSAWPPFRLGAVFMGTHAAVAKNPEGENGWVVNYGFPLEFLQSAGDARHVLIGARKITKSATAIFERIDQAQQKLIVETVGRANFGKLVGIIPPDSVTTVVPVGLEHFFGLVLGYDHGAAMGGTAGAHKGAAVLRLEGAV